MNAQACRYCGAPITFRQTERGAWQPIDADGVVHFATCPGWKRPTLPDHVCLACGSLNVVQEPGKGPHYGAIRCQDCGAHRWLRRPAS